jgi:HPt (histidine-containing phosphotransfer) domain-containing protein
VTTDAVLDPEVIAALVELGRESENPGFVGQLVALFCENAPGRMASITVAVAQEDGVTLEGVAHTLKSNCAMLGAGTMAGYLRDLEAMGERRAFGEAAALLPIAIEEFARVRQAIADLGDVTTAHPE